MVTLTLQIVAGLLGVLLVLPFALIALGISRVRGGILSDERRMEEVALPAELVAEIAGVGGRPVGLYWESAPLNPVFVEQAYACPAAAGFVTAYRLGLDRSVSVAMITGFESGSAVFTQNYEGGLTRVADGLIAGPPGFPRADSEEEKRAVKRPASWILSAVTLTELTTPLLAAGLVLLFLQHTYLVWVGPFVSFLVVNWLKGKLLVTPVTEPTAAPNEDDEEQDDDEAQEDEEEQEDEGLMIPKRRWPLNEVLAEHQRRVEAFRLAGDRPVSHATIEDFLQTQRIYNHHPTVVASFRLSSLETAWGLLAMLAGVGLGMTWWCGELDHAAVWGVVATVAGLLWWMVRPHRRPAEARLLRELKDTSLGGRL